MKINKSYNCIISGNLGKTSFLEESLDTLKDLSWYIFNLRKMFGINWWWNQKQLYHQCRKMFPEIHSKILQNFIRYGYSIKKGMKLPKKPVSPTIFLDYQTFNVVQTKETKLSNFWLRFCKRNFPLFGKRILSKLNLACVKLVQIFRRRGKLYCKLSESKEILTPPGGKKIVGCDVNFKTAVFSNNMFSSLKQLAHRKMEHKKNNQRKRNLTNYSKDYLHKVTTQISNDLHSQGVEVLVLEDLRSLRKSASKKLGTSKGRLVNYIINSMPYGMFQTFLKYKCLDRGILVETINPAYTSKTCSRCGSLNTSRPRQQDFLCLDCGFKLHADLNGSRNIEAFYTNSQWATSESSPD